MPDCPTCGRPIHETLPPRDASPTDHKVGRAVRAVLNELVGQPNVPSTREFAVGRLQERLMAMGLRALAARELATNAINYMLGPTITAEGTSPS
jgi:hypothetical protein